MITPNVRCNQNAGPWPGNPCELENVIHMALLQATGRMLSEQDVIVFDPVGFIGPLLGRLSAAQKAELAALLNEI